MLRLPRAPFSRTVRFATCENGKLPKGLRFIYCMKNHTFCKNVHRARATPKNSYQESPTTQARFPRAGPSSPLHPPLRSTSWNEVQLSAAFRKLQAAFRHPPRRLASGRVDAQLLRFINPFLPSPWEGDLSPSLPFPVAPGRSVAASWEGLVTHFSNICKPLGASGPSCFTIFPIFSAILAKFQQNLRSHEPGEAE